jgi:hypothetical protein
VIWAMGFCLFLLSLGFGGTLDLAAVLDFVDSGHDLLIAADSSASDLIKSVATECGVDFDEVSVEFVIHWLFLSLFLFCLICLLSLCNVVGSIGSGYRS